MRFFADLHIHSRYSLATSRDLTPECLWRWGQLKGIRVIGTGDFTHPIWLKELEEKLAPSGDGLLALRDPSPADAVPESCRCAVSFLLSAEISCIYRKAGRTRKVHCLVLVPDFDAARRLNRLLEPIGSLVANGRPILKLDAKELLSMVLEVSPHAMLIPAHAWTPHFSIFGAASGFESLQECFEELAPHVRAIETGLSSDPAMNGRLSCLDGITLVSNSDAHSAAKLGREATIFDSELSYLGIINAIADGKGVAGTVEFYPQQGKYHADGHRGCCVRLSPAQTIAASHRCPACGRKVTVGVSHRIELLADRSEAESAAMARPFVSVIPLMDLIAGALRVGTGSKKAQALYFRLLEEVGNEFYLLLEAPLAQIGRCSPEMARAVRLMRTGEVEIEAGYDGIYGTVSLKAGVP